MSDFQFPAVAGVVFMVIWIEAAVYVVTLLPWLLVNYLWLKALQWLLPNGVCRFVLFGVFAVVTCSPSLDVHGGFTAFVYPNANNLFWDFRNQYWDSYAHYWIFNALAAILTALVAGWFYVIMQRRRAVKLVAAA